MSKLIIFSAPSGAGKTTIVKELLKKKDLKLKFSISAASRKPREGELHAKDYYFLTAEEFKMKIKNNEFLEWEEVYKDHFYGTLLSEVERIEKEGNQVIFDVDVVGGLNIKKQFKEKALAVFVMPPSIKELENRLIKRNTDSSENIAKRVAKAKEELDYSKDFDIVIVNDNLGEAINKAHKDILGFLKGDFYFSDSD